MTLSLGVCRKQELQYAGTEPGCPPPQVPALFDEVAIYFSDDEWDVLTEPQKALYREVMRMNYETVLSLGKTSSSEMCFQISCLTSVLSAGFPWEFPVLDEEVCVHGLWLTAGVALRTTININGKSLEFGCVCVGGGDSSRMFHSAVSTSVLHAVVFGCCWNWLSLVRLSSHPGQNPVLRMFPQSSACISPGPNSHMSFGGGRWKGVPGTSPSAPRVTTTLLIVLCVQISHFPNLM